MKLFVGVRFNVHVQAQELNSSGNLSVCAITETDDVIFKIDQFRLPSPLGYRLDFAWDLLEIPWEVNQLSIYRLSR